MGKGNRPATCVATSKRLRAKSWYYRNGKYYYNKRAWLDDKDKQAKEASKAAPVVEPAGSAPASAPKTDQAAEKA